MKYSTNSGRNPINSKYPDIRVVVLRSPKSLDDSKRGPHKTAGKNFKVKVPMKQQRKVYEHNKPFKQVNNKSFKQVNPPKYPENTSVVRNQNRQPKHPNKQWKRNTQVDSLKNIAERISQLDKSIFTIS